LASIRATVERFVPGLGSIRAAVKNIQSPNLKGFSRFFFWGVFYKVKFKPLWEVFEAMGWGLSQLNCHIENLMNFSNN
jgi:hypothetical protein